MPAFTINQALPTMNEIIAASKKHWATYSKMKKEYNNLVVAAICDAGCVPLTPHPRVSISCTWYENGRKRDPDNVFAGIKFVLDAMVDAGVVVNDTRDNISTIMHHNILFFFFLLEKYK